jgi:hypothetical protein
MKTAAGRWMYEGFIIPAVLPLLLTGGCATENAGLAACKRGEYGTALNEFQRNGTPEADFALGMMYCKGEGVRRNLAPAASFFRRAAADGRPCSRAISWDFSISRGTGYTAISGRRPAGSGCRPARGTAGNPKDLKRVRILLAEK